MTRIPALFLAASLLCSATPVLAQPKPAATADDAKVEEARQRFVRGVDLYKEGSFDAALAEFKKAYELAPNYRVLYNLGQVQTERHDYVAATKLLEQYLDQGGGDIGSDRRDQVARELASLKGRVADLTVVCDVDGAELLVDGQSIGTTPLSDPLRVSAGVRQVQLRKPGYQSSTRTLTIAGGEATRADFRLEPEAVAAPAGAPLPPSEKVGAGSGDASADAREESGSRAPMWITLAATGVFAGTAITFGVLTKNSDDQLSSELDSIPANQDRIDDARSELKRNALLTDGFTAAAAVTGGFFLYFALSGGSSSNHGDEKTAHLRLAPAGAGLRLLGDF